MRNDNYVHSVVISLHSLYYNAMHKTTVGVYLEFSVFTTVKCESIYNGLHLYSYSKYELHGQCKGYILYT